MFVFSGPCVTRSASVHSVFSMQSANLDIKLSAPCHTTVTLS